MRGQRAPSSARSIARGGLLALLLAVIGLCACVLTASTSGEPSVALFVAPAESVSGVETSGVAASSTPSSASVVPSGGASGAPAASAVASSVGSSGLPVIAPLFPGARGAPSAEARSDSRHGAGESTRNRSILKVLVGLALTVVLAIFAAHPKVRNFERQLGLTLAVASGLPFMVLGVIFQHPSIDVLDAEVLRELGPFIEFGLGWVGFVIGMEFDVRKLDELADGLSAVVVIESLVPFVFGAVASTAALYAMGVSWTDGATLRNGLIIGACSTVSAATAPLALARGAGKTVAKLLDRVAQLDDASAIVVLLFVSAWFRPLESTVWQLPAIAWLFVTVGLGTVLGVLVYALLRAARDGKEELALTLGAIAFSAGVSGRLALSPLVVCAVAGGLFANLPRRRGSQLQSTLVMVERPLVLMFMLFAGATAPFGAWQGWVLLPLYVAARALGKWTGVRLAKRAGPPELREAKGVTLALMPQSPTAIAAVLAAASLYGARSNEPLGWMFTAILVGTYLNDVGVQIFAQRVTRVEASAIDAAARSLRPEAPAVASLHRAISADEAVIEMANEHAEADVPIPEVRVPPPPRLPKLEP